MTEPTSLESALLDALPNIVREGRIDIARLRDALGPLAWEEPSPFGLRWSGREDAFEAADQPPEGAFVPPPDGLGTTHHTTIEGDNLRALRLLQAPLVGRVRLITIDPPYNTGKAFTYDDNFRMTQRDYLRRSGQKKSGRDTETDGRMHAMWLSMMVPRLVLARRLLRDDGTIFICIDDREVHNLRLIMDEIFGQEHFVAQITWRRKKETASDSKGFAIKGEYILAYRKSTAARFRNLPLSEAYLRGSYHAPNEVYPKGRWRPVPITASKGHQGGGYTYAVTTPSGRVVDRTWLCPESTYRRYASEGRLYFGKKGNAIPQRVMYAGESRGVPPDNLWIDLATNKEGKKALVELLGESVYDTPKPVGLLRRILHIATDADAGDVVLDFFAGSGTAGHAVMEANAADGGDRRFVVVQRPEPTGHERFPTISAICRARLSKAAEVTGSDIPIVHYRIAPEVSGKTSAS